MDPCQSSWRSKTIEELLTLTRKIAQLEEELRKARGRPALDVSMLADGDDKVELTIVLVVSVQNTQGRWPSSEVVYEQEDTAVVTWNDLFRTMAPRIAPFATDAEIRTRINAFLRDRFSPPGDLLKEREWVSSVKLTEDAFNVIKVQFSALGLMTMGKEESADGQMTVVRWRLTEEGVARMNHALAVRRRRRSVRSGHASSRLK